MSEIFRQQWWAWAAAVPLLLAGCGQGPVASGTKTAPPTTPTTSPVNAEEEAYIKEARAELSPDDRRLVEAQEFCPLMPDNRLGVMGKPIKVMVEDQPVFVCCKGCIRKAQKDPDKTLAKVEEFKAKVKASAAKN
jgi:hypothetical protein